MPSIPTRYNWGAAIKNVNETLYNQLSDVYSSITRLLNQKTSKAIYQSDPELDAQINVSYDIGDIWINTVSNTAWIMTSRITNTQVVWTQIT